jgi:hypothetical protein
VVIHAQNAYALTSGNAPVASRITELTEHAIRAWRRLAEMDEKKARTSHRHSSTAAHNTAAE